MKKFSLIMVAVLMSLFFVAHQATAAVFVLDFEGLQDQEEIAEYYNGGFGGSGSGPGPDFGVSFGAGALALIDADAGGSGNFANEPSADTIAFWLTASSLLMNVDDGFDTGFSFFYTSSTAATVTVYDGLNATGNVLAQINLIAQHTANNCTGDPTGTFCNWDPIGVAFAGVAQSVSFAGTANQTGYDNITFGSETPQVPEPATLLLLGTGLLGLGLGRKRFFK